MNFDTGAGNPLAHGPGIMPSTADMVQDRPESQPETEPRERRRIIVGQNRVRALRQNLRGFRDRRRGPQNGGDVLYCTVPGANENQTLQYE